MPAPDPIPDLLKAANDISGKMLALWIAFLTVMIYLAISISTTDDIQIIRPETSVTVSIQGVDTRVPLDNGVKLPLLGVSISPDAFYRAGPPMFLALHVYLVVQLFLLLRTLRMLDDEIESMQIIKKDKDRIRAQFDPFIFTQDVVGSRGPRLVRILLSVMTSATITWAPLALLLGFQIRFLRFHDVGTTWLHRLMVILDLMLMMALWSRMLYLQHVTKRLAFVGVCVFVMVFSVAVATTPGEPLEQILASASNSERLTAAGERVWWPTWVLFERDRTFSIFARYPALEGASLKGANLRGRDLRGAHLAGANLENADLTFANLKGTFLRGATLRGAQIARANLDGVSLAYANLANASLAESDLRRADLRSANMPGVNLEFANLSDANLSFANLRGASLERALRSDTILDGADLTNADLNADDLTQQQVDSACGGDAKMAPGLSLRPCTRGPTR